MAGPVKRQLNLLLTAYGYNLYENKNRMRADDLLVREHAAGALGEAANLLRTLRTDYRHRYVPPPTRDHPEPPPGRLEQLAAMARVQDRFNDVETRIRSMAVPTQDRVWERFRREESLLSELLLHDYQLIQPCQDVCDAVRTLTTETWSEEAAARLDQQLVQIDAAIRARALFLQTPV